MSNLVVVDDQALSPQTGLPVIQYIPTNNWRSNAVCIACDVEGVEAQQRAHNVSSGGTWTSAWWETDRTLITASLDFQGSSIAAYFIFFWRSLDPNSRGQGTLRFYVDNEIKLERLVNGEEFAFEHDISPRTLIFQESNLDPDQPHNLRVSWSHVGGRPRVSVAIDSFEYIASPNARSNQSSTTSGPSAPFPTTTGTSDSRSQQEQGAEDPNRLIKIVVPTVVLLVLLLVGLIGLFLLRRRRNARKAKANMYDPSVETSEGRRYPHLAANPYFHQTMHSQPSGLQIEPFYLPPSTVVHDGSSQITAPSTSAYTTTTTTQSSRSYPHTSMSVASPPAYSDTDAPSSAGRPGADDSRRGYHREIRKS